jgi:hypothetical protein
VIEQEQRQRYSSKDHQYEILDKKVFSKVYIWIILIKLGSLDASQVAKREIYL